MKKVRSIKKIWMEVIFAISVVGLSAQFFSYSMYGNESQSQLAVHNMGATNLACTNNSHNEGCACCTNKLSKKEVKF